MITTTGPIQNNSLTGYGITQPQQVQTERASMVNEELNILEKEISVLGNTCLGLVERIDPILKMETPAQPAKNEAVPPLSVPLANRIRRFSMNIAAIRESVASATVRVEV